MIALTNNTSLRKLIAIFILINMALAITVPAQDVKTNPKLRYKALCNGTAYDRKTKRVVSIATLASASSQVFRPILTEQDIRNNPTRYGKPNKFGAGLVWDKQRIPRPGTVPFVADAPEDSNQTSGSATSDSSSISDSSDEACAPKGSNLRPPSPGFHEGDIVEGFYSKDGMWYAATVSWYDPTRPNKVHLLWDDGNHGFVKALNVRHMPLREDRPTYIRRRRLQGGFVLEPTDASTDASDEVVEVTTGAGPLDLRVTGASDDRLNGRYNVMAALGAEDQRPQFQAERVRGFTSGLPRDAWTNRPYYEKNGGGAAIFFDTRPQRWRLISPHIAFPERPQVDYSCRNASALPPTEGWTARTWADVHGTDPANEHNSGLRVHPIRALAERLAVTTSS